MNAEDCSDIVIEALEVFVNHILYVRELYPAQIFKRRRIYNTPIYVSIFPPLNAYMYNVLRSARELRRTGELQSAELLLYRNESQVDERYTFHMTTEPPSELQGQQDDEFLLDFEEQLGISLYKLAERVKNMQKLPNDTKFKLLLRTTQSGFVRLSHNPHYQDFPWLHESLRNEAEKRQISLLPLTSVNAIGLRLVAEYFN